MIDEQRSGSYGDYLRALAFRTLHEESTLQPRRASVFETEPIEGAAFREPQQAEPIAFASLRPSTPLSSTAARPGAEFAELMEGAAAGLEPRIHAQTPQQQLVPDGTVGQMTAVPVSPRSAIDKKSMFSGGWPSNR